MTATLDGANILITGGTGSFGSAFVRHVLRHYKPARLVVYSRDEMKQYEMAQRQSPSKFPCLRYFIGDVRDLERLRRAMHGVQIVVHAAALKHIPAAEYNPIEAIKTNVIGAENVIAAAIDCGAARVVALSTDKAANPINLYGATKLCADKLFIAANSLSGTRTTRFAVVRYGNVLNSRGSVVPYFRRLLAEGVREIPVTDPRMTRFWISLEQGVAFVCSAITSMRGGEIFIPKIPSMKVTELAAALAPKLPIKIVGIRPGEKLHEIMIGEDDARTTVELPDRYVIEPAFHFWSRDIPKRPGARPVPDEFVYSSRTNTDWLSREQLLALLAVTDT